MSPDDGDPPLRLDDLFLGLGIALSAAALFLLVIALARGFAWAVWS